MAVVELAAIVFVRRAGLAAKAQAVMKEKRVEVRERIFDSSEQVAVVQEK